MQKTSLEKILTISCFLLVLFFGAYFRFTGINWDENYHLHPDERFLTMIETSIQMEDSVRDYFDTGKSTLNPHNILDSNGNQTFPFFVYGNFPIILVRFLGELLNQTSYSEIHIIGRYLSGIFDLGTIILIYFLGKKISDSKWVGIISAALYSFAALPIQISHFFIVDNFTTFFTTATFFISVQIYFLEKNNVRGLNIVGSGKTYILKNWKGFRHYFLFALVLGLAVASKLNSVVAAILLPVSVSLALIQDKNGLNTKKLYILFRNIFLAGLLSFIFFRIFQPYAFSGPTFFNFSINQEWLNDIKELQSLSSGLSNYPPSLQWTRRSVLFPLKNMIFWGMGLAFGVSSFISVILLIWQLLKGKKVHCFILLLWNVLYIAWQAIRWNPTMRYFLLVYPTMAVSAGWLLGNGIDVFKKKKWLVGARKYIKYIIAALTMALSLSWGFAFINIYQQPMTRIDASEWIYKNIEGPININFEADEQKFTQPLSYSNIYTLNPNVEIGYDFVLEESFTAEQMVFDNVMPSDDIGEQYINLTVKDKVTDKILFQSNELVPMKNGEDRSGGEWIINFPSIIQFNVGGKYSLILGPTSTNSTINFTGDVKLRNNQERSQISKSILKFTQELKNNGDYRIGFIPFKTGVISGVNIYRARSTEIASSSLPITVDIIDRENGEIVATGTEGCVLEDYDDYRGEQVDIGFDQEIILSEDKTYDLIIRNESNKFPVFMTGTKSAKETDWDDTLPLFMYGVNPFDLYSGIYQSDLNFQMYWDDNADKYERFLSILDQADYIIFSSNRQWGSITQAPEKYPLSTALYQGLLNCGKQDVQTCYINAEPTTLSGPLGYELVQTFDEKPEIFGLEFNTQNAEEAFSVYDHPKVFIFKKTEAYSFTKAKEYLGRIDLEKVVSTSPQEIEKNPGILELSAIRWREQRDNGTWSELFVSTTFLNQSQFLQIIGWYLLITFIGFVTIPLTRIVFKGLRLKGWGLSKAFGLILLSFLVWIGGSNGISVTRTFIFSSLIFIGVINIFIYIRNKNTIKEEIKSEIKGILIIELVFFGLFMIFLLVRVGNPDLWHPYKGGEKPMDFSYFNALIKSAKFPPYDPWYAGGYINYYYWGFLLAAVPTKLIGITPSIAYNLILPTFFAMTGIGVFAIATNLIRKESKNYLAAGLISILFVLIIGNLGTVKMVFNGFQRLGELNSTISSDNLFSNLHTIYNGIIEYLKTRQFNYYPGDWYWIPSRSIPGEPITEFPFFTFLYGDPHAHLFAYPITLLSFGWSLSLIKNKWRYKNNYIIWIVIFSGALICGTLRTTNTWDFPVFLMINIYSIVYSYIKYRKDNKKVLPFFSKNTRRIVKAIIISSLFLLFTFLLFEPYSKWYGQAYTSFNFWDGEKTPIGAYLNHWGIFLFIICTWIASEVIIWMKSTPLSRIYDWRRYRMIILSICILLAAFWIYLLVNKILISLITIPLITISFLLSIQKKISDNQRIVFLMVSLAGALTLLVEMIVLSGDIGRMNTVFKFYLQAWTFMALSASYALYKLIKRINHHETSYGISVWRILLIILLFSGILYPVFATADKVSDRITDGVPLTIDGMDFMQYAQYYEDDEMMNLSQDYQLIRWMQENIKGTPCIMEANMPEYRWGSRVSIYTGLPSVIGWNWHQRQQRAINPAEWVYQRVDDVGEFYSTTDWNVVEDLLKKYQIEFVVIGQLERIIYPEDGIAKFVNSPNNMFELVYGSEETMLLKVNKNYD